MESVLEGDDFAFFAAGLIVGIFSRQFQRRFIGFRPGVTEEHLIGKGRLHQRFRQLQHRFIGIAVADMPEVIKLRFQRRNQRRMGVPERVNGNTAR